MFDQKNIVSGGIIASFTIAAVLTVGPVGSLASVARADGPPVSATINRIANQKGDEGQAHAIYMTFRNNAPVSANEVRFEVRQGRDVVAISDNGTFATGVDIAHRFANPNASFGSPWQSARVAVTYVHFTDGSTWTPVGRAQARAQS